MADPIKIDIETNNFNVTATFKVSGLVDWEARISSEERPTLKTNDDQEPDGKFEYLYGPGKNLRLDLTNWLFVAFNRDAKPQGFKVSIVWTQDGKAVKTWENQISIDSAKKGIIDGAGLFI